ncbi:MAG: lamin tail domain-containing protein [Chloroflexota bacterium]
MASNTGRGLGAAAALVGLAALVGICACLVLGAAVYAGRAGQAGQAAVTATRPLRTPPFQPPPPRPGGRTPAAGAAAQTAAARTTDAASSGAAPLGGSSPLSETLQAAAGGLIETLLPLTPQEIPLLETLVPGQALTPGAQSSETPGPAALPGGQDGWCLSWNGPVERGRVVKVIDGVTIEVEIDGQVQQVRYIGAGMLDFSSDYTIWTRSTEANRRLVEGQNVLLYRDVQDQDSEGRRLRYVIAGGKLVNQALIEAGYANAVDEAPNLRCSAHLLQAESRAINAERGLWAATATPTRTLIPLPSATVAEIGQLIITKISERGTIWEEPEEYVEFRNDSDWSIQLKGWTLQDEAHHTFVFPNFVLGPGQYCRVYTNEYHPTSCGFSYFSLSPIWENDGDCAYIKDALGRLVHHMCYQ